jgi:ribosomal protein L40E
MKVNYTTKNGRLVFEFEADNQVGVWKQLASLQEVFEEEKCQKCGGTELRFSVRKSTYEDDKGKIKDCEYHELRCRKCGAKLAYGVLDDNSYNLFPKRKDKEGNWRGVKTDTQGNTKPTYGWVKWNPETNNEE